MAYDEMELDTIGDEKTALFLIMSDTDSTFNFVIAILQSQLTKLLCDKADDVYGGPARPCEVFIAAVKKYTDLRELDAAVLRVFIDRIEVSHVDKKSRTREITIVYNFIGAFDFTRAIENARNTSKKEQRTA